MEEEIKTKKLIIVDNDGNPRIELRTISNGEPQILLRDKKGVPSINISIWKENPGITLLDSDSIIPDVELEGTILCNNQLSLSKDRGKMALRIGSGIYGDGRIILGIGEWDESMLVLFDNDNHLKAIITSGKDNESGNVGIFPKDKKGNTFLDLIEWAKRQNNQ